MGSPFDGRHLLGVTGNPQGGKTSFVEALDAAAGISRLAAVECSEPIVHLSNLYLKCLRQWISCNPRKWAKSAIPAILAEAHSWYKEVGDGLLPDIPECTFSDPSLLDQETVDLIVSTIHMIRRHPDRYLGPITLETKSTGPIRPMLSASNLAVSRLACRWLQSNGYPQICNLWPYWGIKRLEQMIAANPHLRFLFVNGVRLPGDDDLIHLYGGRVASRVRPSVRTNSKHAVLATESRTKELKIDVVIQGDCDNIQELNLAAMHFLWLLEQNLLPVGLEEPLVLETADMARSQIASSFRRR